MVANELGLLVHKKQVDTARERGVMLVYFFSEIQRVFFSSIKQLNQDGRVTVANCIIQIQGCHSPGNLIFHDLSMTFPD